MFCLLSEKSLFSSSSELLDEAKHLLDPKKKPSRSNLTLLLQGDLDDWEPSHVRERRENHFLRGAWVSQSNWLVTSNTTETHRVASCLQWWHYYDSRGGTSVEDVPDDLGEAESSWPHWSRGWSSRRRTVPIVSPCSIGWQSDKWAALCFRKQSNHCCCCWRRL